ncbi:MAG TPA: Xaa-Pro peptidase family protein [Candidatus Saccharimonadales bacterium]|nr:Xaa-Pro peptidase family protein [Candidatus Saccharimonadales bacterium]
MNSNISKFGKILKDRNLQGFIVTNPVNIFYLCTFRGISQTERESFLVFNPSATLIAPRLYQKEAKSLATKDLSIFIARERNELWEKVKELLANKKCGFEQDNLTFGEYQTLAGQDPDQGLTLVPCENLIENMRMIKTQDEIEKIEKAQLISQKAFDEIIKTIKAGQTEEEISERLKTIIRKLGGEGLAFESIIASGPNSGVPHHITGKRKIKNGDILLFDFGAKFQNYHADLSRTVFVGKAKDEHKNIFWHVQKAQAKALKQIKTKTKTNEAFNFANNHFVDLKLEEFFTHGLGHGIGLEIHEPPYLRATTNEPLLENMVFSIEPGLYFDWGGVRIEDLVVIKNGRAKVLGKTQDEIIEI